MKKANLELTQHFTKFLINEEYKQDLTVLRKQIHDERMRNRNEFRKALNDWPDDVRQMLQQYINKQDRYHKNMFDAAFNHVTDRINFNFDARIDKKIDAKLNQLKKPKNRWFKWFKTKGA